MRCWDTLTTRRRGNSSIHKGTEEETKDNNRKKRRKREEAGKQKVKEAPQQLPVTDRTHISVNNNINPDGSSSSSSILIYPVTSGLEFVFFPHSEKILSGSPDAM